MKIAYELVTIWRKQDPPGRFLIRTDPSQGDASLWHDIGEAGSIKKALTSLRQQSPTNDFLAAMRKQDSTSAETSSDAESSGPHSNNLPAFNTWTMGDTNKYVQHSIERSQDTTQPKEHHAQFIPWQHASQHCRLQQDQMQKMKNHQQQACRATLSLQVPFYFAFSPRSLLTARALVCSLEIKCSIK